MGQELIRRSGNRNLGWIQHSDEPPDFLTGTSGAYTIAAIYGLPLIYTRTIGQIANTSTYSQSRAVDLRLLILTSTPFL